MSAYTKQAIKNSFLKLLNDRPLNQVTVKAIVEDCGINRNTFYYHFTDIPSLATEIITERADQIIRQYANPDSPEACLNAAVQFMTENRRAVMHMYRSISHDTVAFYLMQICRHTVEAYASAAYGNLPLNKEDREILTRFWQCECYGQIVEWLSNDMKYDIQASSADSARCTAVDLRRWRSNASIQASHTDCPFSSAPASAMMLNNISCFHGGS